MTATPPAPPCNRNALCVLTSPHPGGCRERTVDGNGRPCLIDARTCGESSPVGADPARCGKEPYHDGRHWFRVPPLPAPPAPPAPPALEASRAKAYRIAADLGRAREDCSALLEARRAADAEVVALELAAQREAEARPVTPKCGPCADGFLLVEGGQCPFCGRVGGGPSGSVRYLETCPTNGPVHPLGSDQGCEVCSEYRRERTRAHPHGSRRDCPGCRRQRGYPVEGTSCTWQPGDPPIPRASERVEEGLPPDLGALARVLVQWTGEGGPVEPERRWRLLEAMREAWIEASGTLVETMQRERNYRLLAPSRRKKGAWVDLASGSVGNHIPGPGRG